MRILTVETAATRTKLPTPVQNLSPHRQASLQSPRIHSPGSVPRLLDAPIRWVFIALVRKLRTKPMAHSGLRRPVHRRGNHAVAPSQANAAKSFLTSVADWQHIADSLAGVCRGVGHPVESGIQEHSRATVP